MVHLFISTLSQPSTLLQHISLLCRPTLINFLPFVLTLNTISHQPFTIFHNPTISSALSPDSSHLTTFPPDFKHPLTSITWRNEQVPANSSTYMRKISSSNLSQTSVPPSSNTPLTLKINPPNSNPRPNPHPPAKSQSEIEGKPENQPKQ